LDGFSVYQLKERNAAELVQLLNQPDMPSTVLLQYVGYGYHKRGCPLWLVRALRVWKTTRDSQLAARSSRRLITMFHELYASGPPTQSIFYFGLVQRWIVRQLHQLSSASVTSTVWTERLLNQLGKGGVFRQPIPSNIPAAAGTRGVRSPVGPWKVLIFGQSATRLQTLSRHLPLLAELHRQSLLGRLVLIGPGAKVGSPDATLAQQVMSLDRVELCGEIPAAAVADKFAEEDFALSSYPAELACKSGSLMAALANGCPVILNDDTRSEPLMSGHHFLRCDGTPTGIEQLIANIRGGALDQLSNGGREWYETNASWPVAGKQFARLLVDDLSS
jgi:hypothetical protein